LAALHQSVDIALSLLEAALSGELRHEMDDYQNYCVDIR
jgi:hypothetical protein